MSLPEQSPQLSIFRGPDDNRRVVADRVNKPVELPKPLRPAERDALLAQAEAAVLKAPNGRQRLAAMRDRLIVNVALYVGCRVTELVELRVEHFDLASEKPTVTIHNGKGGKDRMIPLVGKLPAMLKDWIGAQTTGWLFFGECGYHLSQRSVQERLKLLGKAINFTRFKLRPHTLRHTAATIMLDRGATIREVQEFLGHASVRTTEVYTHVDPDRLRAAVERL